MLLNNLFALLTDIHERARTYANINTYISVRNIRICAFRLKYKRPNFYNYFIITIEGNFCSSFKKISKKKVSFSIKYIS